MNYSILIGIILILGAFMDLAVIVLLVAPRVKQPSQKKVVYIVGALGASIMAGVGLAFLTGVF